jgi:peptide/nickel transport system ATP-binding protein
VSVQAQVLNLLMDLQETLGLAMLFISHDLAVVGSLCDDILVLKGGVAVELGPAAQVMARPDHPYTRALLAAAGL